MNTIIEIHNELEVEIDLKVMAQVLRRVTMDLPHMTKCHIYVSSRVPDNAEPYKHPGMLEWNMSFTYLSGSTMYFGIIQRCKDAEVEFHT